MTVTTILSDNGVSSGSAGIKTTGGNDGTLALQTTTAAGAATTAVTISTSQVVTFAQQPVVTTAQSMIRVNTDNATNPYGSTATKIRRWTNTVTNQGSDITLADDATNATRFTINTNGIYAITYGDAVATIGGFGISLNASSTTTNIYLLAASEVLVATYINGVTYFSAVSWTGYLASGSIIRGQTDGFTISTGNVPTMQFTITRVA